MAQIHEYTNGTHSPDRSLFPTADDLSIADGGFESPSRALYEFLRSNTLAGTPSSMNEISAHLFPGLQGGRNQRDRAWNQTLGTRNQLRDFLEKDGSPVTLADREGPDGSVGDVIIWKSPLETPIDEETIPAEEPLTTPSQQDPFEAASLDLSEVTTPAESTVEPPQQEVPETDPQKFLKDAQTPDNLPPEPNRPLRAIDQFPFTFKITQLEHPDGRFRNVRLALKDDKRETQPVQISTNQARILQLFSDWLGTPDIDLFIEAYNREKRADFREEINALNKILVEKFHIFFALQNIQQEDKPRIFYLDIASHKTGMDVPRINRDGWLHSVKKEEVKPNRTGRVPAWVLSSERRLTARRRMTDTVELEEPGETDSTYDEFESE